ncbi:hypothetical protein EON77_07995, partial [bacterium]
MLRALRTSLGRRRGPILGSTVALALASLIFASGPAVDPAPAGQSTGSTATGGRGTTTSTGNTSGRGTSGLGTSGLGSTGFGTTGYNTAGGDGTNTLPGTDPLGGSGAGTGVDPRTRRVPRPAEEDVDPLTGRPRRIGLNAPYRSSEESIRRYETGPFERLESFGYSYFASARDAVEARRFRRRPRTNDGYGTTSGSGGTTSGGIGRNQDGGSRTTGSTGGTGNGSRNGNSGGNGNGSNEEDDSPTISALENFIGPEASAFANVATPAPERYQLGAGDRLLVRFSSPTYESQERRLTVDAGGS